MFNIGFANVLADDTTDESELENSQLIRVRKTTSFQDELHDRIERRKQEQLPQRQQYISEDQKVAADFVSSSKSWEQDAVNKAIPLAMAASDEGKLSTSGTGMRKLKKKKQKNKVGKNKTSTKKKPAALILPKTYASVEDLTYIPKSMAVAIPSIEWNDTIKAKAEGSDPDVLTSNCFEVTGVLGRGKGTERSLPEYEFDSLWQYLIPSNDAKDNMPWNLDPAVPPPDIKLKFLSVVSCVSLGVPLDLERVAERGFDLHYYPDSFTPVVMRLKSPVATAMLFKSGKMVVTGTKTEKDNQMAIYKVARRLQRMGFPVRPLWCQIQNLTATCNLGFRIRVHLLAQMRGVVSQYHPELFTGVTITFTIPRAKAILFRTGSILITGVKSEKEAEDILKKIYPLAKLYAN